MSYPAIWLRTGGGELGPGYIEVLIEVGGRWVRIVREGTGAPVAPISHIVEPTGIEKRVRESGYSSSAFSFPPPDGEPPRE